jgi:phospholipid/cholesterol/gamma-HCH transport system substrate-binding protein
MVSSREVKVGAFVLAGLSVVALVIFMIGEERRAFASKENYYTVFNDVQGLRRGSPVRMGGVDIGSVAEVSYGENSKDTRIYVELTVVATEARRIRADSVASIAGKGLLGDKMIVLSVGDPEKPKLPAGATIRSESSDDMGEMIAKLGQISVKVEKVVGNLERTTDSLADAKFHDDLKASLNSLSRILASVERGEGYVGKLVTDPAEARRVSDTLQNLQQVTSNLEQTTAQVNQVLARVQSGPGLAHEVVYGEEGSKVTSQFGQAAEELGLTLKGIREGKGIARGLLFGDGSSEEFARDLSEVSEDLKAIVADLRAGKGTLGALLVDPSVYEDLKLVLGNVQRNKALRALVRYSIRQDGGTPRVEDPDPTPPAAEAPAAARATQAPLESRGSATLGGSLETDARTGESAGD